MFLIGKVIEYCTEHQHEDHSGEVDENSKISSFDQNFFTYEDKDKQDLVDLILAANYMDIKPMLVTGCRCIGNNLISKVKTIKYLYNVKIIYHAL